MQDDITSIDQDPVTGLKTFNLGPAMPGFFQGRNDMVGNRADMTVRSPAGNNHDVCNRRLAGQIDGDDLFGFVILKNLDDQILKRMSCGQLVRGGLPDDIRRPTLRIRCQRIGSL